MSESRVPAGVPTGGQFSASARTEADVALTAALSWRDQLVAVEGRTHALGNVFGGRFFHGSKHFIDDTAMLEPGRAPINFKESDPTSVSVTSCADIAFRWARRSAAGSDFYVYEIEPVDHVQIWRAAAANYGRSFRIQEGRVTSARVLRQFDLDEAHSYERHLAQRERDLVAAAGDKS